MKSLTRNKDLDKKLLTEVNDIELSQLCQLNTYFRNLCKDENIWRERTMRRFDPYFIQLHEKSMAEEYKNRYSKTWREYYISLVDIVERIRSTVVENIDNINNRKDIQDLLNIAESLTNQSIDSISKSNDEWKKWLDHELNNLDVLLDFVQLQDFIYLLDYTLAHNRKIFMDADRVTKYLLNRYIDTEENIEKGFIRLLNDPRMKPEYVKNELLSLYKYNNMSKIEEHHLNLVPIALNYLKEKNFQI